LRIGSATPVAMHCSVATGVPAMAGLPHRETHVKASAERMRGNRVMTARTPLRIALANWSLAVVFAFFAYAHVHQFLDQPRASLVLIVLMESLLVFFILVRREPDKTWHSPNTWLTTVCGTAFPLLLRPADVPADLLLGQTLQLAGAALQVAALVSLNRSMGLLPAHRGVQTSGLYRFVRHPLYAAYFVSLAGYLISNVSLYNLVIIVGGSAMQVMRLLNEERLLSAYPDYVAFAGKTRWRLVPFVW
jgi:protein-S-isoprenylcysteine O-methyltransferase Ste14